MVFPLFASAHVILRKRDVGATIAWVGLIWLAPVLGVLVYSVLGVNRIQRRAARFRLSTTNPSPLGTPPSGFEEALGKSHSHLLPLAHLTQRVARRPITAGNHLLPLRSGDEGYPRMLDSINKAERSVSLCSYIFNNDEIGQRFVEVLKRAMDRGVEVRVLVDAAGARYSWPSSIMGPLNRAKIPSARFLPTSVPWRMPYANLRNHRKVLVVDGKTGFTGGLNIRDGNESKGGDLRTQDLHFLLRGPVVRHLQSSFAEDWLFATGESLDGDAWFPELRHHGSVLARGISDGPDHDLGKLRWAFQGGLDCARKSVKIVTPYFLPDSALVSALSSAALRGVEVDIVLPQKSNLALVQWASTAMLWQVLEHGCRVWLSPPPFDHSKLMVVDECWSFVGSGNWDPRSLRLNFEFNVECYDAALGRTLGGIAHEKIEGATLLTLDDVHGRSLPVRLRDGVARLFTPFL